MSNRLVNLAKAVTTVAGRKIHPSEKLVLLALADDARDCLGGRTKDLIINRQLQELTGLSERAVRMAISALIADGHISRQPGKPGCAMDTLVHPQPTPDDTVAPGAEVAAQPAEIAPQPATIAGGSYSIKDKDQDNQSPTPGRAREPAALDEVDQVFAAWDAWAERCGLPGPVTRTPARRAAVAAQLAQFRVGQLIQAIDRAERGYRAGKFNRGGQGDLWFTFDKVFEVAGARGFNLLARLLDGEFGVADAAPAPPAPAPPAQVADEGPAEARIRAEAVQLLGNAAYQAWLAPARLAVGPDGLTITTASAFAADHITNQIAPKLRRPGLAVRVTAERICA